MFQASLSQYFSHFSINIDVGLHQIAVGDISDDIIGKSGLRYKIGEL